MSLTLSCTAARAADLKWDAALPSSAAPRPANSALDGRTRVMLNSLMERQAERLKQYWSSIGAGVRPGVAQTSLESFESKYDITLPGDFRDYFSTIDGMEEGCWDNEMIRFWQLHCVKSVPEALSHFAGVPDYSRIARRLSEASSYFVFADFLIWSHVYAIKLGSRRPDRNQILWICGSKHHLIAESFSDFLQMYLENSDSILFPKKLRGCCLI